jgi:hypothetical protein
MGFKIEKVGKQFQMPEGNYLVENGQEYLIHELTISASGKVCMKVWNPRTKEHQIKTICTIEELVLTIPGAQFREC